MAEIIEKYNLKCHTFRKVATPCCIVFYIRSLPHGKTAHIIRSARQAAYILLLYKIGLM